MMEVISNLRRFHEFLVQRTGEFSGSKREKRALDSSQHNAGRGSVLVVTLIGSLAVKVNRI